MRVLRFVIRLLLSLAALATACAGLLWFNLVPPRFNPLSDIDLARPDAWFMDWKLARLRSDSGLCRRVLHKPWVEAQSIPNSPAKDGCGWTNGVHLLAAGNARLHAYRVTCEMTASLALWMTHEVQPRAQQMLGARIASVQHFGTYACRNMKGNPHWSGVRSEHARANALDVAGFTLSNGKQISVLRDWGKATPEGRFLRAIHAGACPYFRVAIGPDYNQAHRNHFHYDRGIYRKCK